MVLGKIIKICSDFKEKKFNIEEFQSRLHTLKIEEGFEYLSKLLYDVDNQMEEIRFCKAEINFYKYGVEIADALIKKMKDLNG
jgi:hypothetical protein